MKYFVAFITLVCSLQVQAQCSDWENLLGYKEVYIRHTVRDRFGNLYVTGTFSSTNFVVGTTHLPAQGIYTYFLLKFNKNLTLEWAKSAGGGEQESGMRLAIDKDDNVIVGGYLFSNAVSFDCIQLVNTVRQEIFLVKYSTSGHVIWAKASHHMRDGSIADIVVTATNDIVVSGMFLAQDVSFDGTPFPHLGGGFDSYVLKLSSAGTIQWVTTLGGVDEYPDYIMGMDVDQEGRIVVTGMYESSVIYFGAYTLPRYTISENYFLAMLNAEGEFQWVRGSEKAIDQLGSDVVFDTNNTLVVAGRFYHDTITFDSIVLPNQGGSDVFLVRYDLSGNVLQARSFGGTGSDSSGPLALDNSGNVVACGYYYSNTLSIDAFTFTKSEFYADAFIITFDDELNAVCAKRVSGDAESIVSSINIDQADNIWLTVDDFTGGTANFDNVFASHDDIPSVVVSIGDQLNFDPYTASPTNPLGFSLGNDQEKCRDESITLDAGIWCSATYTWNNGSHGRFLNATLPGLYWVEITTPVGTGRDSVVITDVPELVVTLGADRAICQGQSVVLNATQSQPVDYEWNDGSTLPVRSVSQGGLYSVMVTNRCEAVEAAITLTETPDITFELGDDQVICSGESFTIDATVPGDVSYEWNDGSAEAILTATASGSYSVTVSNACQSITDSITIRFLSMQKLDIPNVITPNGDAKNDTFELPEELQHYRFEIFNRWGKSLFQTDQYRNTWSAESLSAGVYYYTLTGPCESALKGFIHVVK